MAIRATCAGCGKTVKGGDDWIGRSAKCPGCGATIVFSGTVSNAAPPLLPDVGLELKRWAAETTPPTPGIDVHSDDDQVQWAAGIPPTPAASSSSAHVKRLPTRPVYSSSPESYLSIVVAGLMFVGGVVVLVNAQSVIHEIFGGVAFIVGSVMAACSALCAIHSTIRDVAAYAADLVREQTADARSDLAEIKADLTWLRSVKEKEIVRAKAAAKESARD